MAISTFEYTLRDENIFTTPSTTLVGPSITWYNNLFSSSDCDAFIFLQAVQNSLIINQFRNHILRAILPNKLKLNVQTKFSDNWFICWIVRISPSKPWFSWSFPTNIGLSVLPTRMVIIDGQRSGTLCLQKEKFQGRVVS
jgi:hypothetical protein